MFPAPGGRRPPRFPRFGSPLVCQRCRHHLHLHPYLDVERPVLLAAVVEGAQLPRYLGCAARPPGDHYYLPAELIEMVDGLAPTPSPCPTTISPSKRRAARAPH